MAYDVDNDARTVAVSAAGNEETGGAKPMAPGAQLGRYVVESLIGRGGMGEVYAARDPDLDRRVALKLLRSTSSASEAERARFLREGQAIAAVSHPNVIEIYDAGSSEQGVFLAMELLDGATLKEWIQRAPSWTEVVDVYLRAGRGLVAAHTAGLVHRDFKPANVMLTRDGRVIVLDFGLVQAAGASEPAWPSLSADSPSLSGDASAERLTQTGFVIGTPAYMAPEQAHGGEITPYCDQFAFCVSLFEALYGHRPFAGDTTAERIAACAAGRVVPPPDDTEVPARIERVLRRGLAHVPLERWSSVRALLDALAADRDPRLRWVLGGVFGLAAAGVVAASVVTAPAVRCEEGASEAPWTPAVEQTLQSEDPAEALRLEQVRGRLHAWSSAWADAHASWCTAEPDSVDPGAEACLYAGRDRFGAMVKLVADDDVGFERTRSLLNFLDPPADCLSQGRDAALFDAEAVSRGQEIHALIMDAHTIAQEQRLDDAEVTLREALSRATEQRRPGLRAHALMELASIESARGEVQNAMPLLEESYAEANAAGDDGAAAEVAIRAARHVREVRQDSQASADWLRAADAALERGGPMPDVRAQLLQQRALSSDDPHEAIALLEKQRELLELLDDDLGLIFLELNLAARYDDLGDHDTALRMSEALLPRMEAELGAEHRMTARAHINLSKYYREKNDMAAVLRHLELALPVLEAGDDRKGLVALRVNISDPLVKNGKHQEALEHLKLALKDALEMWGPDHLTTATVQGAIALVYDEIGDYDESERYTYRALETRRQLLGPDDPWIGKMEVRLGNLARDREKFEEALPHFESALAKAEPGSIDDAIARYGRGTTLRDMGRLDEGIADIEAAVALVAGDPDRRDREATMRLALAKAYWSAKRKADARAAATHAATVAVGAGEAVEAKIATWLSEH